MALTNIKYKEIFSDKDISRFFSKVDTPNERGCCNWLGGKNNVGYGYFQINNRFWYAHRIRVVFEYGELQEGKIISHSCDNPSCVEIKHLKEDSPKNNMIDMVKRKRGRQILSIEEANFIRDNVDNISIDELMIKFDVSRKYIVGLLRNKNLVDNNTREYHRDYNSSYIGVQKITLKNKVKWSSSIYLNGKTYKIYYGDDEIEAAVKYDQFVIDNNLNRQLNFPKREFWYI